MASAVAVVAAVSVAAADPESPLVSSGVAAISEERQHGEVPVSLACSKSGPFPHQPPTAAAAAAERRVLRVLLGWLRPTGFELMLLQLFGQLGL